MTIRAKLVAVGREDIGGPVHLQLVTMAGDRMLIDIERDQALFIYEKLAPVVLELARAKKGA